jgi:type I restriction enzyme S subunit
METTPTTVAELVKAKALIIGDGYRAKNSELGPVGLPFARAGNVRGDFNFEGADLLAEENVPKARHKVSQPGDVVFTSKGTVGRFAFVRETTPRFVYSPQLCFWRVTDSDVIDARFLFYWMHTDSCEWQFEAMKEQTDMADFISLRDQMQMRLDLPHIDEQRAIGETLASLDDRAYFLRREAEHLVQLRQTLLPGLLAGTLPKTSTTA